MKYIFTNIFVRSILALATCFTFLFYSQGEASEVKIVTSEKEVYRIINEIFPKGIVPSSQIPVTYNELNHQYKKLVKALNDNLHEYPGIENGYTSKIVIVRSNISNAFAAPIMNPTTGMLSNSIIILTTAFLGEYLHAGRIPELDFNKRFLAAIAVMAHELAHSIDKADPEGLERAGGGPLDLGNSIAIEMRTDIEALKLLQYANLPIVAKYYSEQILAKLYGEDTISRLSSLVSTHPEITFRSAYERAAITLLRYRNGAISDFQIPNSQADLIKKETKKYYTTTLFKLPSSFEELESKLSEIEIEALSTQELNALILWFDNELAKNTNMNIRNNTLNVIRRMLMSSTKPICETKKCLEELFADAEIRGLKQLDIRPHRDFMSSLEFYNSPLLTTGRSPAIAMTLVAPLTSPYVAELNIRSRPTGSNLFNNVYDFNYIDRYAHDISRGYSFDSLVKYIHKLKKYDNYPEQLEAILSYFLEIPSLSHGKSWLPESEFLEYANIFHTQVISDFVSKQNLLETDSPLYYFNYHYAVPTHNSRRFWTQILSRNKPYSTQEKAKKIIESIWNARGMWTSLEFLSNSDFHIAWDLIAEVMGIPSDQLRGILNSSFKDFISNKIQSSDSDNNFEMALIPKPKHRPSWLSASTGQFINNQIQFKNSKQQNDNLKWAVLSRHYLYFPEVLNKIFAKELSAQLNQSNNLTLKLIHQAWATCIESVFGKRHSLPIGYPKNKVTLLLNVLETLNINPKLKNEVLDSLLVETSFSSLRSMSPDDLLSVYRAFLNSGRASSIIDFLQIIIAREMSQSLNLTQRRSNSELVLKYIVTSLSKLVRDETPQFAQTLSDKDLLDYIKRVADCFSFAYLPNEYIYADNLVRELITEIQKRKFLQPAKLQVFKHLTKLSISATSDEFFINEVLPGLQEKNDTFTIRSLLREKKLRDSTLIVQLAHSSLSKSTLSRGTKAVIDDLNKLVPVDSNAKDRLLEKLAWQNNLHGENLKRLIEDEKSTNWRKRDTSPLVYNASFTELLRVLDVSKRMQLMDYIIKGSVAEGVLDQIISEIKNSVSTTYQRVFSVAKNITFATNEDLDVLLANARTTIVTLVNESTPVQRVPILEYIMTVGEINFAMSEPQRNSLLWNYLKINPQSLESALIKSYLDVIPEHERALTLAYLILNSRTGNNAEIDICQILETFGTIGIKFGQLAATWDLFGEPYTTKLKRLFNNSTPMTKFEIESVMIKIMGEKQYRSKIKRIVKILGSASIKTVVLVELTNGKMVAVMLKRPGSEGQTSTNIKLSKSFIERLKHYSVESTNPLFMPLIDAVEQQMINELDFMVEVKNIRDSKSMIQIITQQLSHELSDWSIDVPNVVDDIPSNSDIFSTDAVDGVSAEDYFADPSVPEHEKKLLGSLMTKISLRMLTQFGKFDPDRHPGNWLIDRVNKKVFFIDAGQLVSFPVEQSLIRYDGRLAISQFLEALDSRQGTRIVEKALNLRRPDDKSTVNIHFVASQIDSLIRKAKTEGNEANLLKEVVTQLYRSGIQIDGMYTFGAIKGLMTLMGSQYVNPDEFKSILAAEILKLYIQKAPIVLATGGLWTIGNVIKEKICQQFLSVSPKSK